VSPERLTIEALVKLPSGLVSLVGVAWLGEGAQVTPDEEHDDFAWWPREPERWPAHADDPLKRIAGLLSASA
jgi:hypothetical protein